MNSLFVSGLIFIAAVVVIELLLLSFRLFKNPDRGKIRRRIRTLGTYHYVENDFDITKKIVISQIPWLNRFLLKTPGVKSLFHLTRQANAQYPPGFFILLSLFLGFSAFLILPFLIKMRLLAFPLSILAAAVPFLYLQSRKRERMKKFHKQLPDALDLLARSLKAGHALTTGMKLVAEEYGDPVGAEFEETVDEINFGISVSEALKNLSRRVDCTDLKFFVIAVIIQRETGGNLAEIIETIAELIRQRFNFEGKVRVLTAEGRISAYVLIGLPIFIGFVLYALNPRYMGVLLTDPAGHMMLALGGVFMAFGYVVIKKMVQVTV